MANPPVQRLPQFRRRRSLVGDSAALFTVGSSYYGLTLKVELAMGDADGPLRAVGNCLWYDVTAYCRGVGPRRGRQSELTGFSPGTLGVTFANQDRRFDPSNTAGQFYGKLTPMRRIRVSMVIGNVSTFLFTGYVKGWPITFRDQGADSVVTVQCVSGERILELANCANSAYGADVILDNPSYYWPCQTTDSADTTPGLIGGTDLYRLDSGSAGTISTYTYPLDEPDAINPAFFDVPTYGAYPPGVVTPQAIEMWVGPGTDQIQLGEVLVASSSTDFFSVKPSPTYVEVRYSTQGKRDSTGSGVTLKISSNYSATGYHLAVRSDGTTLSVLINGEVKATDTLTAGSWSYGTGRVYITLGDTIPISHAAAYTVAPSADRFLSHYLAGITAWGHPIGERAGARINRILDSVGWPSADRDIGQGETVLGPWEPGGASALSQIRQVEDTEQGLFYIAADGKATFRDRQYTYTGLRAINSQATFGEGAGEIGYHDITIAGNDVDYVRNKITVSYPNGSVTVEDTASSGMCGEQTDSVAASALPPNAGWLARVLANFRLVARKTPVSRVPSLLVKPLDDLTNYATPIVLLELGDRVRVIRRPTQGAGNFDQYCTVQGINHQITPYGWDATLYLSPAPASYTEAEYLVVNDPVYGLIGEASGNLIPY